MTTPLRLLSYNIQVGIGTNGYHEYLTQSWRHLLPHRDQHSTLDGIAALVEAFDLVGLQEVDGGSLRSRFINQTEFLAQRSGFPCWYSQTNRRFGNFAHHSLGALSRMPFSDVREVRLPGRIPGRGALMARFESDTEPLLVVIAHLALGQRTRTKQIAYIASLIRGFRHVIVMGDFNCTTESPELKPLLGAGRLREALPATNTFPSWRPTRNIDHVLLSPDIGVITADVLDHRFSDHLPIALELDVPLALMPGQIGHIHAPKYPFERVAA